MEKIAFAYGIGYIRIESNRDIRDQVKKMLAHKGPMICEVMTNPKKGFMVRTSSFTDKRGALVSRPLEDMAPFLPRDEFRRDMIIKPIRDGE